jgi:glyoxylase-like metal-dependent hydrolase (beta-lactamase superfamily II)
MDNMHQSDDNKFIPMTSFKSGKGYEIRDDVYYYINQIVNVIMVGFPGSDNWVLIDAGMPKSSKEILDICRQRFGDNRRPSAIILTHGHFDHVGSIVDLIEAWKIPVYAHPLEFPYLTGKESYPDPDTSVEGGMLAKISSMYPTEPITISDSLNVLPEESKVPGLNDWEWIHTPGHSPGHISLFRKKDKTLIAGDAFVTVRQDSFYKVLTQQAEVNGPPVYLTTDWTVAKESVKKLDYLKPDLVISGHGPSMEGDELKKGLSKLAREFDEIAVPGHGKYVDDENRKKK